MPREYQVKINVDSTKAEGALAKFEQKAQRTFDKLNKTSFKPTAFINGINVSITKVMELAVKEQQAATKIAQANAKIEEAHKKVVESNNKLAEAEQKTAQAKEKTAQAEQKTAQETAKAQAKIAQSYNKALAEYHKVEQAQKKVQAEHVKGIAKVGAEELRVAAIQEKVRADYIKGLEKQQQKAEDTRLKEGKLSLEYEKMASKFILGQQKMASSAERGSSEIIKDHQAVADNFTKVTGQMSNAWNQLKMIVGFAGVAGMLRSAFNEMKAMSDELITYQKVTGATAAEVAKVRASAYQSAGRYGQTPSDFLASVAVMARAGYGEQSEAMADLATKTQLVGDMTSEAASKFLIAVDAGYQLKGNIESLSNVLDKANIIDNNYATSLSKVADAMTLIAPLSASMNVSIEETMAAIGTMSAVTQREGTEVARAYRMIALNIAKDTETEVEEGVKLTEEEIKSLNDILQVYAATELKAADATGKLLSPMKAIEAISKAWRSGALNEQELFKVLNGIGGARYTNSIMALVKNFDMYEDMLSKFVTEMGSADAEVDAMTKGWTAKFNQLKVAWTEMVNNAVSEDFIRQLLDISKGFLQWTGNLQTFVGVVGGATVSLKLLKSIISGTSTAFTGFGLAISAVITAVSALNAISERRKSIAQQEASAAAESAKKAYEQAKSANELYAAYKKLAEDGTIDSTELSEAESIQRQINSLVGELPEKYDLVAGSIENNVEALRKMNAEQRSAAITAAREAVNVAGNALTSFGKNSIGQFTGFNITNTGVGNWPGAKDFFLENLEGTPFQYRSSSRISTEGITYTGGTTPQDLIAAYSALESIINAATEQGLNEKSTAAYTALIETRNRWATLVKDYQSADEYLSMLLSGNYGEGSSSAGNGGSTSSGESATDNEAKSWDRLAKAIENATNAKKAFDTATETTKADQINDYASVYATLAEELKNGRVNSTATHAALQMLLGDEAYAATGGKVTALQEAWTGKRAGQMLSAAESYEILTGTYQNQNGQTVEGAGIAVLAEKVGMEVRDELGNYMLDFTDNAKLEQLSSLTGVTVDALRAALNAYDQYDVTGTSTGAGHPQEQDGEKTAEETYADAIGAQVTATDANTAALNSLTAALGGETEDSFHQKAVENGITSAEGEDSFYQKAQEEGIESGTGELGGRKLMPNATTKNSREKIDMMIASGEAVVVEQPNGSSIIIPREDAGDLRNARVLGIVGSRPEFEHKGFPPMEDIPLGPKLEQDEKELAEYFATEEIKASAKSIVNGVIEAIQEEEESPFDINAQANGSSVGTSTDSESRAQETTEAVKETASDIGQIVDKLEDASNEDLAYWRAMASGAETGDFSGYEGPYDIERAYKDYKQQYGEDVMDFIYDRIDEARGTGLTEDQKSISAAIEPIIDRYQLDDIISSLEYDLNDELKPIVIDTVLNKYSLQEVMSSLNLVTEENRTAIINAAIAKYGKDAVIAELRKIASNNGGGWAAEIIAQLDSSSEATTRKKLNELTASSTKKIYTQVVATGGGNGGSDPVRFARMEAVGSSSFSGGAALVNDGTGAEMVLDSHGAHVYGGGAPTVTNIERGAMIYTAEQTRSLIASVPHHATGTEGNAAAQLAAELNAFFDYIRTGDTSYTLAGSGSSGSGSSGTASKPNADSQWDSLKELIEYIIKRLGKALEAQEKVIDAQINALQAQKSQRDEQNQIEELQKAVAKAQENLAEAQSQRSVRYIDDNGQWHWMADQKKVQQAQEELEKANKSFVDYLYDVSIEAQVKALESEKTRLSDEYTGYKELWSDILDAVATPTGDLVALIQYLTKNGTGAQRNGATAVREQLITAMLGGSYSANYSEALGEIGKAAANNPSVPGISDAALAALIASSGTSVSSGAMLGALQSIAGNNPVVGNVGGSVANTDNSVQYFINGVQIGSNMANMPLSEILQRLSVYANASR